MWCPHDSFTMSILDDRAIELRICICSIMGLSKCHSGENRNPVSLGFSILLWTPAFAGVTVFVAIILSSKIRT